MNEAQLESEHARKDDARRRRYWISNHTILGQDECYSIHTGVQLAALLKLENKAKQWYDEILPPGYFAQCVANSMGGKLCQGNLTATHVLEP
jgi:hypothetical protein